jgi:type IV secretory pathway VirB2 component (pilin)
MLEEWETVFREHRDLGRAPMPRSPVVQPFRRAAILTLPIFFWATAAWAQQSPWERAAQRLEQVFTGPIARSLALVAIVIGGLLFMFGEGGAKRQISGIVFGGGLALFAAQFLAWLF